MFLDVASELNSGDESLTGFKKLDWLAISKRDADQGLGCKRHVVVYAW